jgi:hypothetical protein
MPSSADNTGYTIQWSSITEKFYSVLRSSDLTALPAFTPIATHLPGEAGITTYTDTETSTSGARFYKVLVEP